MYKIQWFELKRENERKTDRELHIKTGANASFLVIYSRNFAESPFDPLPLAVGALAKMVIGCVLRTAGR